MAIDRLADLATRGTAPSDTELVRDAYRLHFDCSRVEESARSIGDFLRLLAPEIELAGESEIWSACKGRRAVTNDLVSAAHRWAECSFAVEDVREPEPGRVLACGTVLLRQAGTSEVRRRPFADLWTIADGLVVRVEALG